MRLAAVPAFALVASCAFDPRGLPAGDDDGGTTAIDAPAPGDGADPDTPLAIDAPPVPIDALPIDAAIPCPVGYSNGYRYISTHATWLDAEHDCEDDQPGRTHLAAIDNATEGGIIIGLLFLTPGSENALWVGFVRDPGAGMPWRLVTGGNASYLPWSPGEPDTPDTNFVARMEKGTGLIFDRSTNDNSLPALCECDGKPPVNADYDPGTN